LKIWLKRGLDGERVADFESRFHCLTRLHLDWKQRRQCRALELIPCGGSFLRSDLLLVWLPRQGLADRPLAVFWPRDHRKSRSQRVSIARGDQPCPGATQRGRIDLRQLCLEDLLIGDQHSAHQGLMHMGPHGHVALQSQR
jgi:hypothetical protein